jgi:hypothetical protein
MDEQDVKNMWRSAPAADTAPLQEAELARRARHFQRRIARRNFLEYAAALLVCVGFGFYLWKFPDPLMRLGSVLTIAGILVVVWQLRQRASSRALPGAESALPSRDFHRAELVRQRDALRSVWLWYVAPLVPGMLGCGNQPGPIAAVCPRLGRRCHDCRHCAGRHPAEPVRRTPAAAPDRAARSTRSD